jgi:hypothetical protein
MRRHPVAAPGEAEPIAVTSSPGNAGSSCGGASAKKDAVVSSCCGGPPVQHADACCVRDEQARQSGKRGCGCASTGPQEETAREAACGQRHPHDRERHRAGGAVRAPRARPLAGPPFAGRPLRQGHCTRFVLRAHHIRAYAKCRPRGADGVRARRDGEHSIGVRAEKRAPTRSSVSSSQ